MTRWNPETGQDEDGSLVEGLTWAAVLWGIGLAAFFFLVPWLAAIAAEVLG